MQNKREKLRKLLNEDRMIVAPGAPDAMCAKIIEQAGFDVCYMGGNGAIASMLGKPDLGLATFSEIINHARNIANAISIPLICDADSGYGNVNNVIRTVQEYERAGVAGIHIEDQVHPKKCGAMDGIKVLSIEESIEKLKAAVHARQDPNFLIIARTDSRKELGLEEAIKRIQAYEKTGVDMVYVEMLKSKEEVKRVKESVSIPILYDMLEQEEESFISNEELENLGVKITIYPLSATFLIAQTVTNLMNELKSKGTTKGLFNSMMRLHDYEKLLGIEQEQVYQEMFKR